MRKSVETFDLLRAVDRLPRDLVGPGPRSLLGLIARVQRAGRWHLASADALAAALGRSRRSVVRWLAELESAGLLMIWRRRGVVDGVRRNLRSGYRVAAEAVKVAGASGLAGRAAAIAAKAQAMIAGAVGRTVQAARAVARGCANVAHQTRQEDIKEAEKRRLYQRLGSGKLSDVEQGQIWDALAALEDS